MTMTTTILPSTLADSTLNLNSLRAPLASSHAPSMADSLPSINFGFDNLRAHMAQFTQRFDEFIERGRQRVLDERNSYRGMVAEANDQEASAQRSLSTLKQKTSSHSSQLTAQSAETSEMHAQIASLTATRDAHADNVAALNAKVRAQRDALAAQRSQGKARAAFLAEQRGRDERELAFWAERLGLRIEGAGAEDRVRFVFALGASGGRRGEAKFELDMARGLYAVVAATPSLDREAEDVDRLCREMSDNEDLGAFLKGMRALFVNLSIR